MRDERGENFDPTPGVLPLPGSPLRQGQSHHRHRRKLAVLVYRVLSGNLVYNDPGAAAYHQLNRVRELKSLRKRAKLLGFDLLDRATGEVLVNPVS